MPRCPVMIFDFALYFLEVLEGEAVVCFENDFELGRLQSEVFV